MNRTEHIVPDASALPAWRKSSYSDNQGGSCLEVSDAYAPWRKSSYSDNHGGSCLEVNDSCSACVPVRDSKVPDGPALVFGAAAWTGFVTSVKDGALTR